MDKELQSKLVEILTGIRLSVSKAADYAFDQLSDIAQTYVYYGMAVNTVSFVLLCIASGVMLWATCKWGYSSKAERSPTGKVMIIIFGSLASGILIITTGCQIPDLLLVWLAPKVWLLKELAQLAK